MCWFQAMHACGPFLGRRAACRVHAQMAEADAREVFEEAMSKLRARAKDSSVDGRRERERSSSRDRKKSKKDSKKKR